jgi:hypothetical protein
MGTISGLGGKASVARYPEEYNTLSYLQKAGHFNLNLVNERVVRRIAN